MKIEIDIGEVTADEARTLTEFFSYEVVERLRKLRKQFKHGDRVLDRSGQILWVSHVYECGNPVEVELRTDDGEKAWKAATAADIVGIL